MNNPKKLLLFLLLAIGFSFAQSAQAQCQAGFTSSESNGVVTFVNTSTGIGVNGLSTYDFGDGNVATYLGTNNVNHTYTTNGVYLACLTAMDSLTGCVSTFCDSVLVSGASGTPACASNFTMSVSGGTVTFTNTSSNFAATGTGSWNFGDGNSATTSGMAGTTHTYTQNGTYTVCLAINDQASNCSDTYCNTVTITGLGGGGGNCSASFTASESQGVATFVNTSTNLSAGGIGIWNFGDGNFGTSLGMSSIPHTYTSNGVYLVCLTIQDSLTGCTDTWCDSLQVTGASGGGPSCQAGYWWVHDSTQAYTLLLINTSTGSAPLTYFWDFGDGNTSTQAYPSHTYAGIGTYVVCVTITDGNQCTSTFCDSIPVTYKTATPFSINVVPELTTGIEPELPAVDFTAFPNPFGERLTIELTLDQPETVQLELMDITGKVVLTEAVDHHAGDFQHELNTQHLTEGLYMLRISGENFMEVKKVVRY
jgi:PKD repeat protein